MSYSLLFIFILLIESSIAPTDFERLASLEHIHSHIRDYAEALSNIYEGFQELKTSAQYTEYIKQGQIISSTKGIMGYNISKANYPQLQKPVATAEQVIANWLTAAIDLINECTTGAEGYILDEAVSGKDVAKVVSKKIRTETTNVMTGINRDAKIIDEQKGMSCPIYEKLNSVNTEYEGNPDYFVQKHSYDTSYGSSVAIPSDLEEASRIYIQKSYHTLKQFPHYMAGSTYSKTPTNIRRFTKKKEEIQKVQTTMTNNQAKMYYSLPGIEEVPTSDQVIQSWRTEATKLIDDCINDATKYTKDEENGENDVSETVKKGIKDATENTMKAINKERYIIPQQKYSNCPIYEKLKAVYSMYANKDEIAAFEGTYGAAPGPSS